VAGMDLKAFFKQWLYQAGHPKLDIAWTWKKGGKQVIISVKQLQPVPFSFPLEIAIITEQGETVLKTLEINAAMQSFPLTLPAAPAELIVDPSVWLLCESKVRKI
jgi:aminopeptidase N